MHDAPRHCYIILFLFYFVSSARMSNAFCSIYIKLHEEVKHFMGLLAQRTFLPLSLAKRALMGFWIFGDNLESIILQFGLFCSKHITLHLFLLNEAHLLIHYFHAHLPTLAVFLNTILVASAFPYPLELARDFTAYNLSA